MKNDKGVEFKVGDLVATEAGRFENQFTEGGGEGVVVGLIEGHGQAVVLFDSGLRDPTHNPMEVHVDNLIRFGAASASQDEIENAIQSIERSMRGES